MTCHWSVGTKHQVSNAHNSYFLFIGVVAELLDEFGPWGGAIRDPSAKTGAQVNAINRWRSLTWSS